MAKRFAYTLISVALAAFMFVGESYAEDIIQAKVISFSKRQGKLLVMSRAVGLLKKGDVLELNKSCTLEVSKRLKDKALLSTDLCFANKALRRGRSIVLYRESALKKVPTAKRLDSGLGGIDDIPAVPVATSYREKIRAKKEKTKALAEGFYMGLNSAVINGVTTNKFDSIPDLSTSGQIGHQYGLSLGYAQVNSGQMGFTTGLSYNQFADSLVSVRAEANLTYTISPKTYVYGGPSINQISTDVIDNFDIGFGGQIGLGIQFSERIGLNLAYVNTRNIATNPSATLNSEAVSEVVYAISGAEFGLRITF